MKKIIISIFTLIFIISGVCTSFAATDELKSDSQVIILEVNKEIKDKDVLLERAKANINDDQNSKIEIKKDNDNNTKIANTYHTSQLLQKKSVDGKIVADYAATSIVDLVILGTELEGSDYYMADGHVYILNTIYYTKSTASDYTGQVWPCATFTKATGSFTRYDGVATSNHKIVLYEGGIRLPDLSAVGLQKPYTLGTALSYDKTTGFPAMTNLNTYDAPVYNIQTSMNWSRGGSSGVSTVTYTYAVGYPDGEWAGQ